MSEPTYPSLALQSKITMNQVGLNIPKRRREKTRREERMAKFFPILSLCCSSSSSGRVRPGQCTAWSCEGDPHGRRSAPPGRVSRQPSGSSEPLAGACPQTLTPLPRMRASGRSACKSRNALRKIGAETCQVGAPSQRVLGCRLEVFAWCAARRKFGFYAF